MHVAVIIGTRPEIIKMASVVHELKARDVDFSLVHTGQHYDFEMSDVFLKELELPPADHYLDVGSGTQAQQTANALQRLEETFLEIEPSVVLVEGDTNTVLAGALAGVKLGLPVGHVEAGLRSYDLRMPEEHNRRITDHLSSLLFAPTNHARRTLNRENVWGKIFVTGNTVIDACLRYGPRAMRESNVTSKLPDNFALMTAHRAENVDDPLFLQNLLRVIEECPAPVVYPMHPRTGSRFREHGLHGRLSSCPNLTLLPPVGYMDFLALMQRCSFILTDSGGIQEEATAPNVMKKVFVLRKSTERPEAVEAGHAEVVGTDSKKILSAVRKHLRSDWKPRKACPFGRGDAGRRIVESTMRALAQ